MGLGRKDVSVHDASAWVFNRMADVYAARPAYPVALVDAVAALAPAGSSIADIGAGTGLLALPLAQRGFDIVALEPAQAMLEQLQLKAAGQDSSVRALLAAAEALPLAAASIDLVLISDALHFMDVERSAAEVARVLKPGGRLAVVTSELGNTRFMRGVVRVMEDSAPRRPRNTDAAITQLSALVDAPLAPAQRFYDETPVDDATLEQILRSISFIGPAMNPQRFSAFIERIRALPSAPVWARNFTLQAGRRRT